MTLVSLDDGLSPAVFLATLGVAVEVPVSLGLLTMMPLSVVTSGNDALDWRFFKIAMT